MKVNSVQVRFFLLFVIGYFVFDYFFKFWIGLCAPAGLYWAFAADHLNFIKAYRHFLIEGTGLLCDVFGFRYLSNDISIRIVGHGGIKIVYSCLGYGIISILMALAIAVPYLRIWKRIAYLLASVFIFSILNMARLFTVSYYAREARKMEIDHHLVFNMICYLLIVLGMYWWVKKAEGSRL